MHETLETCLITSSSKKILTRVKTRLHSPGTVWVVRIVRYVRPVETVTWQDLGPVTWGNIISFGGKKAGQHQQHQQLSLMTFWSRIVSRMTREIFYLDICQAVWLVWLQTFFLFKYLDEVAEQRSAERDEQGGGGRLTILPHFTAGAASMDSLQKATITKPQQQ